MRISVAFLITFLSHALAKQDGRYAGFQVLRVHTESPHHVRVLQRFQDQNKDNVEIWQTHRKRKIGFSMDMLASPEALQDFAELVDFLQIPYETLVPDLRKALEDHMDTNSQVGFDKTFNLNRYNDYEQILEWLFEQQQYFLDVMSVFQLGRTSQGRTLYAVKISDHSSVKPKPAIWIDAGIHPNEWIGPATVLYFIHYMLENRNTDPRVVEILANYDLYMLPIFNVDGYIHTWTEDRLWRKSRSTHGNHTDCAGVDMNRNWGFQWGVSPGVSHDPCSRTYGGPGPESEPEVQAVIQFLREHPEIKAYLAYHSYSQFWMSPYSYSSEIKPDNYHELMNVSQEVIQALRQVHGTEYLAGSVAELIGQASGSSVDYTYRVLGIRYSFGVELRDEGQFGSLLPPELIKPNAEESFAALHRLSQLLD